MKRYLYLPLLILLFLAPPSMATDYVQCQSMVEARKKILTKIQEIQSKAYGQSTRKMCGEPTYGMNEDQRIDFRRCIKTAHLSYEKGKTPVPVAASISEWGMSGTNLYEVEAIEWNKKAKKILVDMKKEDCPYL